MNKKLMKKIFAIAPLFLLLSCVGQVTESSSSSEDESFSESIPTEGLYVALGRRKISIGKTFMNALDPVVYLSGEEQTFDVLTSTSLKLGNESFKLTDPLIYSGTYTFLAKKGKLSYTTEVQVVANKTEKATAGNGYTQVSDTDAEKYSLHNLPMAGSLGEHKMPSRGTVKLLVIPISFSGGLTYTANELDTIDKGYFGEANETGWQSLKSFYESSSYGKLHITGKVSSVYVHPKTETEVQSEYASKNTTALAAIVNAAVEYTFSNDSTLNRTDYDLDGDGYLDGVELIYKSSKTRTSADASSAVWWNYTTIASKNESNKTSPNAYRYFWSSITQLMNGYYTPNIDAHTLIHETGHMLGLADYYDYQYRSYPTGGADMMELNIGDHNAYSKYLLGWVAPKVVDGTKDDFEITLSSFEESGDCIILRDTKTDPWNGTPYDEYLIMSYHTPTGLNEKDSAGYKEWTSMKYFGTGGTYNYRGLQVFHVDERLASCVGSVAADSSGERFRKLVYSYTDDVLGTFKLNSNNEVISDYGRQISSNTLEYSQAIVDQEIESNSSFKEVAIIPANGDSTMFNNSKVMNGCINLGSKEVLHGLQEFEAKDNGFSFAKASGCFTNENIAFNDGSKLEYNFYVSAQSENDITVRFVRDN